MKHENLRNKKTVNHRTCLSGPKLSRLAKTGRNLSRWTKKKSNGNKRLVALFEKSFIRSINATIWEIEQGNISVFTNASDDLFSIRNIRLVEKIDLPGWDNVDIDISKFDEDFTEKLAKITGRDDIIIGSDFTISCLQDEEEFAYFDWSLADMDYWFEKGYGLIATMIAVYLRENRQLSGYGAFEADYYCQGYVERWDPEDEEEKKEQIRLGRSILMSERRFDQFLNYMKSNIDLEKIAEIISLYAKQYGSDKLQELAEAIAAFQRWTWQWDNEIQPILEESNIFEMIVWFGSEQQHNLFSDDFNQNYGSDDGTYIRYGRDSSKEVINQETLDFWKEASINQPPRNVLSNYEKIIHNLQDEQFIEEYSRISGRSDLNVAVYQELDRMSGCSTGQCGKWTGAALCSSFSQLLKETRRLCV